MRQSTVQTLNQLNQEFYAKTVDEFDQTRSQSWPGWSLVNLMNVLPTKPALRVLDVGCGNGRFAQYLTETYPQQSWEYVGVDSSRELLAKAPFQIAVAVSAQDHSPSVHPENIRTTYIQADVLQLIQSDQPIVKNIQFDIVVCFGVLHHIPSAKNRQLLLNWMSQQLSSQGKLWVNAWQFVSNPRLMKRAQPPTIIGLTSSDLELGDYLLDWRRGPAALRYAHYCSPTELADLINRSGSTIGEVYYADGTDHLQNYYAFCTVGL